MQIRTIGLSLSAGALTLTLGAAALFTAAMGGAAPGGDLAVADAAEVTYCKPLPAPYVGEYCVTVTFPDPTPPPPSPEPKPTPVVVPPSPPAPPLVCVKTEAGLVCERA